MSKKESSGPKKTRKPPSPSDLRRIARCAIRKDRNVFQSSHGVFKNREELAANTARVAKGGLPSRILRARDEALSLEEDLIRGGR